MESISRDLDCPISERSFEPRLQASVPCPRLGARVDSCLEPIPFAVDQVGESRMASVNLSIGSSKACADLLDVPDARAGMERAPLFAMTRRHPRAAFNGIGEISIPLHSRHVTVGLEVQHCRDAVLAA